MACAVSLKFRLRCWPGAPAPANFSVVMPPTSLPKSSTSCALLPDSRVDCPERTLVGLLTDDDALRTATGASVREVGERLSVSANARPTTVLAGLVGWL